MFGKTSSSSKSSVSYQFWAIKENLFKVAWRSGFCLMKCHQVNDSQITKKVLLKMWFIEAIAAKIPTFSIRYLCWYQNSSAFLFPLTRQLGYLTAIISERISEKSNSLLFYVAWFCQFAVRCGLVSPICCDEWQTLREKKLGGFVWRKMEDVVRNQPWSSMDICPVIWDPLSISWGWPQYALILCYDIHKQHLLYNPILCALYEKWMPSNNNTQKNGKTKNINTWTVIKTLVTCH